MEMFYTSLDINYNISYDYTNYINNTDYNYHVGYNGENVFIDVLSWLIICTGLPLILVAIYLLYSLITTDHTVPIYIINLLMSDLIQICCMTVWNTGGRHNITLYTYFYCILVSVGFMACLSLERYLVIAQPVWYRFRRNIKTSVVICVVVWILPLANVLPAHFNVDFQVPATIFAVFLLLPLPLFIFFLVGTLRALSSARSVPPDEKRRIVAILVVVLFIYVLLFLPSVVWLLVKKSRNNLSFHYVTFSFLNFSPLADLTMYIFVRKGVVDKLLASLSCCKMTNSQQVNTMTTDSTSAACSQTI